MKAIVYTRVSTKEQVDEGHSLATQKRLCYEYASKNDYQVVRHFEECGESAKTANRTELNVMLAYAVHNCKNIDAVIIYKIDRLSRNTSDYQTLKNTLNTLGISVVSSTEYIQNTPAGRFAENMLASAAQYDNELRAERSKNGMVDAVRNGRWVWRAPLGYVNDRVYGVKNIRLDRNTQYTDALRSCWEMIDGGYTETEALRALNARLVELDMPPIRIQTLSRMLRNPLYVGVVSAFGMTVNSDTIERLIEPGLFYNVQDILDGKKRKPERYKKLNPDYPLRGTLLCLDGHRMTGSAPRGNGGRYPKYHCPKCRGLKRSYDVAKTDDLFAEYAGAYDMTNELRSALIEAVQLNLGDAQRQATKNMRNIDKQLLALNAADREITNKNITRVYTDEHTKRMLDLNMTERTRLQLEMNELDRNVDDAEEIVEFGLRKLENIGQLWTDIEDMHTRFRFQKWLFPAGVMFDGEKFGTSQIPQILSIKKELPFGNSLLVIPRRIELRLPG